VVVSLPSYVVKYDEMTCPYIVWYQLASCAFGSFHERYIYAVEFLVFLVLVVAPVGGDHLRPVEPKLHSWSYPGLLFSYLSLTVWHRPVFPFSYDEGSFAFTSFSCLNWLQAQSWL